MPRHHVKMGNPSSLWCNRVQYRGCQIRTQLRLSAHRRQLLQVRGPHLSRQPTVFRALTGSHASSCARSCGRTGATREHSPQQIASLHITRSTLCGRCRATQRSQASMWIRKASLRTISCCCVTTIASGTSVGGLPHRSLLQSSCSTTSGRLMALRRRPNCTSGEGYGYAGAPTRRGRGIVAFNEMTCLGLYSE